MTKDRQLREKVLLEYGAVQSLRAVAKANSVSKSTVSNWVAKARGIRSLNVQRKRRTVTKQSHQNVHFLVYNYVKRFPYTTLSDIQQMLRYIRNKHLSITTVHRILKSLRITRKKVKRIVRKTALYQTRLEKKRKQFINDMMNYNKQRVISIDESGIHKQMHPHYGYAPRGTMILQPTTSQRHQNYSLVMAISHERVIAHKLIKGSINTLLFQEFVSQELLPACAHNHYIFLMDNVRFHHNAGINSAIHTAGHTIIYTPPYSPDLNPIERVFSIIKRHLRLGRHTTIHSTILAVTSLCQTLFSFDSIFDYSLFGHELCTETKRRIVVESPWHRTFC